MLMMATTDCVFMQLYEELYRLDYNPHSWYYNGGELPQYALLDQYPGIAFMADEGVQQGIKGAVTSMTYLVNYHFAMERLANSLFQFLVKSDKFLSEGIA